MFERLFIILASLTMIWFSEKMLTSTRCIHVLMSNLIKKSCMDSNAYVCQTTYKRLKNRFRSKGFWPKYWLGFMTVRRNQFIRLATNLKLCGRYVHVFRFNVHAQNYEKHSTYSPFEIWFSGWAFRPKVNFNHWSKLHLNLFLLKFFREPKNFGNNFRGNLKFKYLIESKTQCHSHHV